MAQCVAANAMLGRGALIRRKTGGLERLKTGGLVHRYVWYVLSMC